MFGGTHVGNQLDICWTVGPAGFPYSMTIKQIQPAGATFHPTFYYANSGTEHCFNGVLEASDVPGVQFKLTVVINGVTLNDTSPVHPVNP